MLGVMQHLVRMHNRRGANPNWWRKYFWQQDPYWAQFAAYKSAQKALLSCLGGDGRYYFWNQVCLRAIAHCEQHIGPTPAVLVKRPFQRSVFALSTPEVHRWLSSEKPPFRRGSWD